MQDYNHLIALMLERVASNVNTEGAIFYWDEVSLWPEGTINRLEQIKFIHQAQPMDDVECDGCEENCFMPVTIISVSDSRPARAFITCEMRDDIGRVKVDMQRLKCWQLTAMQLAHFVRDLCGLSQNIANDADCWRLGMLAGKKHKAPLLMRFDDNQALLQVVGHRINLLELLFVDANQCRIDINKLKSFVDSPAELADGTESKEARQDRLLARRRELKSQGVNNFNETIANEEGLSLSYIKKLITAAENRENSLANNKYQQLMK